MRLNAATAGLLSSEVARPDYDRDAQTIGIVHFGIGAFHRAHQAWYTDLAMAAGDRDWAIAGVSLRSAAVAQQLNPQEGLYTLTERSGDRQDSRLIGAVREVLVGGTDDAAIMSRVADPACHIVSFTVTEKGYARGAGGAIDPIAAAASFYPLLSAALARRRDAGLPGVTLLSCDNLADNGAQLARLMDQWLAAEQPGLADWVRERCTFPATMVDRIVPATTDQDRTALERRLGLRDDGAVFTERFSQWVIEDRFAGPRPSWEAVGATLVADVTPYETAKLRMLNGAHSALAYMGLERGHEYIHQAVADADLKRTIDIMLRNEAAPSITATAGQDLPAYADELMARFADPALCHRLAQIAMDGSQKIAQRWLATMAARQERHLDSPAHMAALGAWLRHIHHSHDLDDPAGDRLRTTLRSLPFDLAVMRIFGDGGLVASRWNPDTAALLVAYETSASKGD